MTGQTIRFIDLFAGIGGIRMGLEQALEERGLTPSCVFTSEIKRHAVSVISQNHPECTVTGDITKVDAESIPDFDILCAGFPCQAFSFAGSRNGFADTRGTLFFDVERILLAKRPKGFILENVEGLVSHDGGNTLRVILGNLDAAGYHVSHRVLDSKDFGVAQERRRIYLAGIRKDITDTPLSLESFPVRHRRLSDILETGMPTSGSPFVRRLLDKYPLSDLLGKSVKDKRGGASNIHSWDLELKGPVTPEQKELLDMLMTERRKKKWAEVIGIDWMDGMPLTREQIGEFYQSECLQQMLDDLVSKGYIVYEHPKRLIRETHTAPNGDLFTTTRREYDTGKPKGYNIVAGKLSFEVGRILSPDEVAPTLVATDMMHLYVGDNGGLRPLTLREGLRLFGYPETFRFDVSQKDGFDLLGNTVVVPVIRAVASRLLDRMANAWV